MKLFASCVLASCAVFAAQAQVPVQPLDQSLDRDRIRQQRAQAEAEFSGQQKACRAKFAVNDCMQQATRARNDTLADLRRQEIVLDDAERHRKAAERQHEIDERTAARNAEEAQRRRAEALEQQKGREQRAAGKTEHRAAQEAQRAQRPPRVKTAPGPSGPQGHPRAVQEPRVHGPTPEEAARNRAAFEQRIKDAEAHKAEVLRRNAQRGKAPGAALPDPQ